MNQSLAAQSRIRVLLVEDDEDDYVLTERILKDVPGVAFDLRWVRDVPTALQEIQMRCPDVVLLDYRLGEHTGLDFLGRMPVDLSVPVILLTGQHQRDTDLAAMMAGACDYLVKGDLSPTLLERAIRYAIQRQRAEEAEREAKQQYRTLVESVGAIVWRGSPETLRFTFVSRQAEALLGYPLEQWVEEPDFWRTRIHCEDQERVVQLCTDACAKGETHAFEYRMIAADGGVVWLRNIVRVLKENGEPAQLVGVMIDITEHKRTEEALRQSEERFRLMVEGSGEVYFHEHDVDGRFTYLSPSVREVLGYAPEELVGRHYGVLLSESGNNEIVYERSAHLLDGSAPAATYIAWVRRRDGHTAPVEIVETPVQRDGRITGLQGFARDISQRVRTEQALRESEEKFLQLANHVRQVFWIFAPDFSRTIYVSPAFEQIWGWPVESLYADPQMFLAAVVPEDLGALQAAMARVSESNAGACEYRIRRPDGEERWLRSRAVPVHDASGIVHRVVGTTEDVTDIVRTRTEVERREAHYRRLVQTAPQAVFALDVAGRFIEVNPAAEALLGRAALELIGQPVADVLAAEDLQRVAEARRNRLEAGSEVTEIEFEIVRPDGERRLVHVRSAIIREGDQILGTHGIARDVTDERAQQQRMRLLTSALDGLEQGITISDLETLTPQYRNAAWARLFGCDPENLYGSMPHDFLPDEAAREQLTEIQQILRHGGQWSGRIWRRRMNDSEVIPLDVVFGTAGVEGGSMLLLAVFQDATKELDREQRLRRAERLASLGTLVSGVAHELNNPLHAIRNFADLMLLEPRDERDREALEITQREADRAARVVSDLRTFARQTQEEKGTGREAVDLNEVVQHVLKVRHYTLQTHNVRVRKDLGAHLPRVWASRSEMEQVILNLVVNAEQALAEIPGPDRLLILRTRRSRSGAAVHVVDNGPGISPEHLDRVFDPFFTTKAPGQGSGLGLSLVHSIVEEHGGDARVESEPGKGAAFVVDLPRPADAGESAGSNVSAELAAPDRSLRILVVDDEDANRRVLVRSLCRRGHEVDAAADGEEALRLIEGSDRYDVILSDLRMPGLDGRDLLDRLRARGDGMEHRTVILTGDASLARTSMGVPVLNKPVQFAEIARVVEHLASR